MISHDDENTFSTDRRASACSARGVPPQGVHSSRHRSGLFRLASTWVAFLFLIGLLFVGGWVAWGEFHGSGVKVPRGLTTFRSEERILDEPWFRKYVGLDERGKKLLSIDQVISRLYHVEQIRHVTDTQHSGDNGVDFLVLERVPCLRIAAKEKDGRAGTRFMDNKGFVYRAEMYPAALVEGLLWLQDENQEEPLKTETGAGASATGNASAIAGANTGAPPASDAPAAGSAPPAKLLTAPKPLPRVLGGEELARFAASAKEVLPEEFLTWKCVSAKDFQQGISTLPGAAIRVVLSPNHQPLRMLPAIKLRQVVFSANPERFAVELAEYARPGFRKWVEEKLLEASQRSPAVAYDLCMGEEVSPVVPGDSPKRVARLRPVYARKEGAHE